MGTMLTRRYSRDRRSYHLGHAASARTKFSSATAAVVVLAAHAMAADLPNKAPVYKASPPAVFSWTGFYAGAQVGGGLVTTNFINPFGGSIFGDSVKSPAFLGAVRLAIIGRCPVRIGCLAYRPISVSSLPMAPTRALRRRLTRPVML